MAKALSLAAVFNRVGYVPHAGQQKIIDAKRWARFRWVCAGRRTGKSLNGGHELTAHAFEAYLKRDSLDRYTNRDEYWIVGPEYSDAEKEFRVLYGDLTRLGFDFDRPGTYYDAAGGNMHLSLFDGKFQVHAKSAKYPDTLVGEQLKGVILAEAAKLKPAIWPKYIRPMLIDSRGWSQATTTPEGKNWFYDEWQAALTREDSSALRMPSWINHHLFPKGIDDPELRSLAAGMTKETFNQEIAAEFATFVGKVFKNFDDEVHLRKLQYNPALPVYAAVDYGFTNPFVWLLVQVDHWDNVYVIGEHYERNLLITEVPAVLRAKGLVPSELRQFYPDPASPGDSAVLAETLKLKPMGGTGGELNERLNLIRKWLDVPRELRHLPYEHPERLPKLFIDPDKCPMTAYEMGEYRYPENKSETTRDDSELPLKKDDHTPEALGRFFKGYFDALPEANQVVRVRRASMSGRGR